MSIGQMHPRIACLSPMLFCLPIPDWSVINGCFTLIYVHFDYGIAQLLYLPGLRILCCMAGAAGARQAPVLGVVWVVPLGEMASAGWDATLPVGITVQGIMGASIGWRVAWAAVVAGRRAQGVPSKAAASVTVRMGMGLWSTVMSPMSGTIIGVWSVPLVVGVLMPWMRSSMVGWCSIWRNLVGAVLGKWPNSSQPQHWV